MKVALSFFGQPRYVKNKHIYNSYKHFFLDRYDVDVFCHMWWEENGEYDISSWVQYEGSPVTPDALSIVKEDYNPLVLKTEAPRKFSFPQPTSDYIDKKFTGKKDSWKHSNYSNVLSQLYSIQSSSRIVKEYAEENNVKYDFIVLARYDTILYGIPDLNDCNPNKLHLPHHHDRFPDVTIFYPMKHLDWASNVFEDVKEHDVYTKVFSPSPEGFKYFSFRKRFPVTDIQPTKMDGHCVRSFNDNIKNAKFLENMTNDFLWERSKTFYKN